MKLCYLSSSQLPSRSANSVHVMKICEAFAELGHSVTLFGKASSLTAEPYGFYGVEPTFEIRRMPRRTGWRRKAWLRLRLVPQVRALRPDLVYGRSARGLLAIARLRLPLVFEAHLIPSGPSRRLVQEQLFAAPCFRRLVVISELLRRDYLREFPTLDPESVVVAHDAASPVPRSGSPALPAARPRVGYVGHLYPGKGMETIQALAGRCPWADFHVVGGMEEDLAFWRPRVAELANLTLHGFVAHGEVGDRLESFDVVLAPYGQKVNVHGGGDVGAERWMSPLKIFEYMSHGKPIIATDLPVIREVLEHDRNALLAPSGDLNAWEHALRRLVEDPALREHLGGGARKDFEARYSWGARSQAVLEGL